ncbi:MAG: efflux RND transporter periplasmic adaptor subunit [Burkholderiaceae bacterium]|nr:efflux RND transporter periplasmic adaptor subunit [Burkholderiaceae bacterium]
MSFMDRDGAAIRLLRSLGLAAVVLGMSAGQVSAADLAVYTVTTTAQDRALAYDGVVEAVRQATLSAQVAGTVLAVDVKAGDRVKAGQTLVRIDARSADQAATASEAQVQAARAQLDVAGRELKRQQQLFEKNYISHAAMEQAEATFKATKAQVDAQLAQSAMAQTHRAYFVVKAPFDGWVSGVPVMQGDMAMPGKPLLVVYDPSAMRVTAAVPQSAVAASLKAALVRLDLPSVALNAVPVPAVQVLPAVDADSHTVQVRVPLAGEAAKALPGSFARLWVSGASTPDGKSGLMVPVGAVVRRAELTAVYVLGPRGRPLLRQVRLGQVQGSQVEVLSGLSAGDRVVTTPELAARAR